MKTNSYMRKIVSTILIIVIIVCTLPGCGKKRMPEIQDSNATVPTTEEIADIITEEIQQEIEESDEKTSQDIEIKSDDSKSQEVDEGLVEKKSETGLTPNPTDVSYDWEDYVGDIDTLVYGLLTNEYEQIYDVFNAAVELEDGNIIYGLGYSEFDGYFETEDGYGFFPAGFLAFIGEEGLPDDLVEKGVEVINLDYDDPKYSFVYSYECKPYLQHCVVWDQYLKYGVDEHSRITYTAQKYEEGCSDKTLGSLYSYDAGRYIYDLDVGNYVYLSGTTLNSQIDYEALEAEINRILDEQDSNFSKQEVETAVYLAQEAVDDYLLSLQEETFLGFSVEELIKCSSEIDPMSCIRITPDGFVEIELGEGSPGEPTAFVKWMTGISCGIVIASTVALNIFVPGSQVLTGAISGAAFEVFMQVVINNQNLEDINYSKVLVAATSGAMLAWACPLLASGATNGVVKIMGDTVATSAVSKLAGYATLTFSNALVSGATSAAFASIDGKTDEDVFNAFLVGAAIGGACTAVASVAAEAGNAIMKAHPESLITKVSNRVGEFIGKHQVKLFSENVEAILNPKSVYEASQCAINELKRQAAPQKVLQEAIKQLPSDRNPDFVKFDMNGNVIKKAQIEAGDGNCTIRLKENCDPAIKKAFEEFGISEIKVIEGIPDFSEISVYEFKPINGIGPNRDDNMKAYYKQLANDWIENPSSIPERIKDVLTESQMENLNSSIVQKALSDASLTPHEGTDGIVYLVDRFLHNKIGHFGGVALSKVYASLEVGMVYIKDLINSIPGAVSGSMIAEGAE